MHAQYGLDLSAPGALDAISWRWLAVRVAALGPDTALASALRQRRKIGDVVVDTTIDNEAEAREFWRRRAGKTLAGKGPH